MAARMVKIDNEVLTIAEVIRRIAAVRPGMGPSAMQEHLKDEYGVDTSRGHCRRVQQMCFANGKRLAAPSHRLKKKTQSPLNDNNDTNGAIAKEAIA